MKSATIFGVACLAAFAEATNTFNYAAGTYVANEMNGAGWAGLGIGYAMIAVFMVVAIFKIFQEECKRNSDVSAKLKELQSKADQL